MSSSTSPSAYLRDYDDAAAAGGGDAAAQAARSVWQTLSAGLLAAYTRNGSARVAYLWCQDKNMVYMRLLLPKKTKGKHVTVDVTEDSLRVKLSAEAFARFEAAFAYPVVDDEEALSGCWQIEERNEIRKKFHIDVQGEDLPPPVTRFLDLKLPQPILDELKATGITRPTPIQMQGLSAALAGRDLIGIAFTGSGKTLTFTLPAILLALDAELRLRFEAGEGPVAILIAPSRELARQTYEVAVKYGEALARGGYPRLRTVLLIGGKSIGEQLREMRDGVHIVVATPGRLQDMLKKEKLALDSCRYLCLDEADRLIDLGFEDDIRNIISFFKQQRQTVLFSATMPPKIAAFAQSALVRPVDVNVGRAGAANMDVIQEVEFVREDDKLRYLLTCLQKTPPPVLIFAMSASLIDEIHEYLLLKGVEAVAIHGGKDQEEREAAIRKFKEREKDVLVASDIASKGLDFASVSHVINYDMPKEIENYVHRIGRTGRRGRTGVATTFVNKNDAEEILLDLKYLLIESKQRVPLVLMRIAGPNDHLLKAGGTKGCTYCSGLGHRVTECPKLGKEAAAKAGGTRDFMRD